jgi:hypothetical protein
LIAGEWLYVGSGTTWCHSVCVFCDPVVALTFFGRKSVLRLTLIEYPQVKVFSNRLLSPS